MPGVFGAVGQAVSAVGGSREVFLKEMMSLGELKGQEGIEQAKKMLVLPDTVGCPRLRFERKSMRFPGRENGR